MIVRRRAVTLGSVGRRVPLTRLRQISLKQTGNDIQCESSRTFLSRIKTSLRRSGPGVNGGS